LAGFVPGHSGGTVPASLFQITGFPIKPFTAPLRNLIVIVTLSNRYGEVKKLGATGYPSCHAWPYRIIFRFREEERAVEVHYVGPRKDSYELFLEQIRGKVATGAQGVPAIP